MTEGRKVYAVKDVFRTIQGEGSHAGMPAVFVRFVGCNMWSGDEDDRIRDSKRNDAECPRWCDTDFRADGAMFMTQEQLVERVRVVREGYPSLGDRPGELIVVTGGEPCLQLDQALVDAFKALKGAPMVAVETNGTIAPRFDTRDVFITLSPKVHRERIKLDPTEVDELKLVVPAYDPKEWDDWPGVKYVAPQALPDGRDTAQEQRVAQWVIRNGGWRLSLQTHKVVRVS